MSSRFFLTLAAALVCANVAQAADIEWNGFGSAYYTQSMSKEIQQTNVAQEYPNYSIGSLLGLNLRSNISDKMSAAAQFVATANNSTDSWLLDAKWAYVSYKPISSVTIKGGRQLIPFFFASEFGYVRYLQPYSQIPAVVFSLAPFTAFDGFSAWWEEGMLRLGAYTGSGVLQANGVTFSGNAGIHGLVAEVSGTGWGVHAHAARGQSNMTVTQGGTATPFRLASNDLAIGYRLDKANFVSWGEYSYTYNTEDSETTLKSLRGGYVLLGYRIGDFMPRYTYATAKENLNAFQSNQETTTHTIGLNYQMNPQAVAKVNYDIVNVPDTASPINYTRQTGSTATSGSVLSAGVDFIF